MYVKAYQNASMRNQQSNRKRGDVKIQQDIPPIIELQGNLSEYAEVES